MLARNVTTAANSSGVPYRFAGMAAMAASRTSSSVLPVRSALARSSTPTRSVAIRPGSTMLTVTPSAATSEASVLR